MQLHNRRSKQCEWLGVNVYIKASYADPPPHTHPPHPHPPHLPHLATSSCHLPTKTSYLETRFGGGNSSRGSSRGSTSSTSTIASAPSAEIAACSSSSIHPFRSRCILLIRSCRNVGDKFAILCSTDLIMPGRHVCVINKGGRPGKTGNNVSLTNI